MHEYFLLNLGELAAKRAINMREEAQLWDILSRDLKREARRREEEAASRAPRRQPPSMEKSDNGAREQKLFVRVSEATKMMGISRSSLYVEISAGRIQTKKSGRKTLIALSEIQAWFDNLPKRV